MKELINVMMHMNLKRQEQKLRTYIYVGNKVDCSKRCIRPVISWVKEKIAFASFTTTKKCDLVRTKNLSSIMICISSHSGHLESHLLQLLLHHTNKDVEPIIWCKTKHSDYYNDNENKSIEFSYFL